MEEALGSKPRSFQTPFSVDRKFTIRNAEIALHKHLSDQQKGVYFAEAQFRTLYVDMVTAVKTDWNGDRDVGSSLEWRGLMKV